MTEDEFSRWCFTLDRAIRGEHVTILCRHMRAAKFDLKQCMDVCDHIGLVGDAICRNGGYMILFGDTINDGCIDFSTMQAESTKCGDHRDYDPKRDDYELVRHVFHLPSNHISQ